MNTTKPFQETATDTWCTPKWLWDELNREFNFDVDLCASRENHKCDRWYNQYLIDNWCEWNDNHTRVISHQGEPGNISDTCFMNPPYSDSLPFVQKAWNDSKHCKIVCLLKVDNSTKWWRVFYDPVKFEARPGCTIRLLPRRVKFDAPKDYEFSCKVCKEIGEEYFDDPKMTFKGCKKCKGTGKVKLSGPSFPSCIIIMDRRGLK
jgi:phage N-6-adenine-methyltransferase